MTDSNTANIVLGADDNYALPLATTIFSILKNANPETYLQFHILDGGMADKNVKRIEKVLKKHGKRHFINWIHPDLSQLNEISTPGRPPSIYLPILIPTLLPKQCKKAVFLDCDMIIETDISKLSAIEMDGYPIMAVRDYLIQICGDREGIAAYKELGGRADSPYFNSGVMVLNIELWRKEKWTQKAIDYIKKNKNTIYHYDQGVLNALFMDQWKELDPNWNQQGCLFWPQVLKKTSYTEQLLENYEELVHHPKIIHYLSPSKPWSYKCMHPHANRFLYYLKESGWFGSLQWQTWWRRYQLRRLLWLLKDLKENFNQIKPMPKMININT